MPVGTFAGLGEGKEQFMACPALGRMRTSIHFPFPVLHPT